MKHVYVPRHAVMSIQRDSCCAGCWEPVRVTLEKDDPNTPDLLTIECETPECTCPGLVSYNYVNRRIASSAFEAVMVKMVLSKALPWLQRPRMTEAEMLKALGF